MKVCASVQGVVLLVLLLTACTPVVEERLAPSPEVAPAGQSTANEALVRRSFQAREQGDVSTLNELSDPQETMHPPNGPPFQRRGPYTDLKDLCPMCAALEHRKITIDMMLSKGDLLYVRSTWTGSYTGTLEGIAVNGRDVTIVYSNVYRVVNGRIRDNWFVSDRLSLAEQLGMKLVPAEAAR